MTTHADLPCAIKTCVLCLTGKKFFLFDPGRILCSYLQAKGEYRSEDLNLAATTTLDILLKCQHNSAAQVGL